MKSDTNHMAPLFTRAALLAALALAAQADTECPATAQPPSDRRSTKNTFRLAQFNVEWLFVDQNTGSMDCPGTDCPWWNSTAANTHLSSIVSVLKDLDADMINFCEVEGCDELNMILTQLPAESGYKPYLKKGTDTSTGQNVGMLTRVDPLVDLYRTEQRAYYPVPGSACGYAGSSGTTGVSKHYITTARVGDVNVAIVGAHLLAYPTDPTRCAEREAQAAVLRTVVDAYQADGYDIVIIGDMNDFDGSSDSIDRNGNMPTSRALSILRGSVQVTATSSDGTLIKTNPEGLPTLMNAASVMPREERYTEWWDENADCVYTADECSMIDHVLLSPGLAGKLVSATIAHSEYVQSCADFYYSDHWPVVLDFAL